MKRRYELREQAADHPWRKVRVTGMNQLVPALTWKRGVWDNETHGWHTEPREKKPVHFLAVRTLNGMPPLTPQKVRGLLKKAGIMFSSTRTTRIRGWYSTTSGVSVSQHDDGVITVGYEFNHWAKEFPTAKMLATPLKVLQDAGLNPTQLDDGRIEL
jgi:hypothetical protein